MLVYHPAFDVNHTRYRLLQLVERHPARGMPVDLLRILDFYFLFPHLLGGALLPAKMTKQKRLLAQHVNKYNRVPSPKLLIRQMQGIHDIALRALAQNGLLDTGLLDAGTAQRTADPLPEQLSELIAGQPETQRELVHFLATDLAQIPLTGPQGLKARTGLLEHRYDPD